MIGRDREFYRQAATMATQPGEHRYDNCLDYPQEEPLVGVKNKFGNLLGIAKPFSQNFEGSLRYRRVSALCPGKCLGGISPLAAPF